MNGFSGMIIVAILTIVVTVFGALIADELRQIRKALEATEGAKTDSKNNGAKAASK